MAAPTAHFTTHDVWPAVSSYMAEHPTGGNLHIVLEDNNIEDDHLSFCLRWADERHDPAGVALAFSLLHLSRSQRGRLIGRYWNGH